MKTTSIILGALLIVAGLAGLIFGGIPYQSKETVIDVGAVQAQVETDERLDIPPVAAAILLVGGAGVIAFGTSRD